MVDPEQQSTRTHPPTDAAGDPRLLTLHTLALAQPADADKLTSVIVQDHDEVVAALAQAVTDGTAVAVPAGHLITPAGRQVLADAYEDWFTDVRADPRIPPAMDRFESGVNRRVLKLVSRWQQVEVDGVSTPNLHDDADYDADIIERLGDAADGVRRVLAPLADVDPLLDRFFLRLDDALTRSSAGELDYVSSVTVDSFHTVWFQLHEHILRVTGRERPT